jgi:predicted protein tyrosine phosphatase
LKKLKKVGEEAVSKELLQLHMRDTFEPKDVMKLSKEKGRIRILDFLERET